MVREPGCCAGRPKVQDRTSFLLNRQEPTYRIVPWISRLKVFINNFLSTRSFYFERGRGYSILCLMLCFKWLNFRNLVNGRSYKAHCNKHCHTKNAAVLCITSHNARCDGHKVSRIRAVMSPPLRLAYIENWMRHMGSLAIPPNFLHKCQMVYLIPDFFIYIF